MPSAPPDLHFGTADRFDGRRSHSRDRGYDRAWYKMTAVFRANNPYCVWCEQLGFTERFQAVDHIIPHRGDEMLRRDPCNWQPLCHSHHSLKTLAETRGIICFVWNERLEYILERNKQLLVPFTIEIDLQAAGGSVHRAN